MNLKVFVEKNKEFFISFMWDKILILFIDVIYVCIYIVFI